MNSICDGVAVSSWSASTCLVNGSRRANRMIVSIFLFVDARRRVASGAGFWIRLIGGLLLPAP